MSDGRERYDFWKRRDGDTLTVATERERKLIVSAFSRWRKGRPGNLRMTSEATKAGYLIRFSGLSMAEANRARLNGEEPSAPPVEKVTQAEMIKAAQSLRAPMREITRAGLDEAADVLERLLMEDEI